MSSTNLNFVKLPILPLHTASTILHSPMMYHNNTNNNNSSQAPISSPHKLTSSPCNVNVIFENLAEYIFLGPSMISRITYLSIYVCIYGSFELKDLVLRKRKRNVLIFYEIHGIWVLWDIQSWRIDLLSTSWKHQHKLLSVHNLENLPPFLANFIYNYVSV